MNDKHLWNRLAKENYKYYVYSDKGKNISDDEFELSGEIDYNRFIDSDPHIINKHESVILEIGCGAGRLLKPMSINFKKVIGIDVSEVMIDIARNNLEFYNNINLICTDGETIPIPSNMVDFIFSYTVFQHMKSYQIVQSNFEESYRVLKDGGVFKVLLSYVKYKNLKAWWSGVTLSDEIIDNLVYSCGYKILEKRETKDNRVWFTLEK